jgi:glycosyltransferase involved in cell wall biosynthesis
MEATGDSMETSTDSAVPTRGGGHQMTVRLQARRRAFDFQTTIRPSHSALGLNRVSVVIPAMNEAQNLPLVLPRIPEWVSEVIIVDGNSTDGTPEAANDFWQAVRRRHDDPRLRIVPQEGRGKGAALRTGFAAATGDIIVMLDADGSTDPAEIPRFVGMLLGGMDFAKGSRFLHGGGTSDMPLYRKLGNWTFVAMVRLLFGGCYTDLCYGYNAFWRHVLDDLNLEGDGFEIETIMNVRALRRGLKLAGVPSFEAARLYGESHLKTIPDGWRVLNAIKREWTSWLSERKNKRVSVPSFPGPVQLHPVDRAVEALDHQPGQNAVAP